MALEGSILQSRTLAGQITQDLRSAILDGAHLPGSQLRQDALAAAYGVSRIPVREALIQLEAEGLVHIVPHKGAVVTTLSPVEVNDIFALRLMLEPRLLAASLPLLNGEDIVALRRIDRAFDQAIERQDRGQWGALNAQLHMALFARAPMPRTLAIVSGLLQASERYTRLQLASEAAWQRARSEHGQLIDMAEARDVQRATMLLEQHIEQVRDDLCAMMVAR